ncbi:glycine--tRNA ligase subunit beta [Lichenicoccus sp.]|uniref:glycine--tRNA ligase subunit beta n=1 Tax=Lichenicoccus sp. TaxID=2781899 RepID=UPI003D0F2745
MAEPGPNFLIELFSEEIPAGVQASGAETLRRLLTEALAPLAIRDIESFSTPRRIALAARLDPEVAAQTRIERGPREGAPEQALAGFLRKHDTTREALRLEGGFWVLQTQTEAVTAATLVARTLPALLRRFPWPKAMRWSATSAFTWMRPLRRILCVLDGKPVRFGLSQGDDDGHGLIADSLTEGHRFLAPGPVAVTSLADWRRTLRVRHVLVDPRDRVTLIREGIASLARAETLTVAPDEALLEEVAGLVEWPVPMLGTIDAAFMDLPPEVMQVSMRSHQRYFALRTPDGVPAPRFAFIAGSIQADDGALAIAGNERVLRARFSDARHFWDLDRKTSLEARVARLDAVRFHAALGSQSDRVRRLERLAALIAPLVGAEPAPAARAARLAKADLLTGMVGEFPELQGVMGEYYARHDGEPETVARAIREHYLPRGAGDDTPRTPVSIAVALADRIDSLAGFFAAGEKPGGSGDPYALRRAALGIIRIVRDNALRLDLHALFAAATAALPEPLRQAPDLALLPGFIAERLRVQLRTEGARHDVLAAVNAAGHDGDLVRLLARTEAVANLLNTAEGADLLAACRRAANILRIEDRKDGPHAAPPALALYVQDEERALAAALDAATPEIDRAIADEQYDEAMTAMAVIRAPLDRFFEAVTVNADAPALRRNRLRLLANLRDTFGRIADLSLVEG